MRELHVAPQMFGLIGSAFFLLFSVTGTLVGLFVIGRVRTKWVIAALAAVWMLSQLPIFFTSGFAPGARPLAPTATADSVWFSDSVGSSVARVRMDGSATEFATPRPASGPRAIIEAPDGHVWLVLAEGNAIACVSPDGVMREFRLPTPNASPRGITVAHGSEIWFTQNLANTLGRMSLETTRAARRSAGKPPQGGDRVWLT